MADIKWVKLTVDMFDNRKIKHIRKLPEGNNIVLIWVMLLTMAGRCNAAGMIFLTENIPYTNKMLADELGFDESIITIALNALEKFGMITRNSDVILIHGWNEHQNIEGMEKIREQNRLRKKKQRELQKENNCDSHAQSRDSHATEKEKEKEEEKDKEKKHIVQNARDLFECLWDLYPLKRGKGQVSDTAKKRLLDIGYDQMERAINRYKADLEKDTWRKPQNGSTFFNSGYVDYLDKNYSDELPQDELSDGGIQWQ